MIEEGPRSEDEWWRVSS